MAKAQFIRTEGGEELVVLSRSDYERLLADAAEEHLSTRVLARTRSQLARGEEIALPEGVWERIEAGLHPIVAIREFRELTQAALSREAGISQGYLSEIENRKKTGDVAVLLRIAAALRAPLDVLVDDAQARAPSSAASSPGSA